MSQPELNLLPIVVKWVLSDGKDQESMEIIRNSMPSWAAGVACYARHIWQKAFGSKADRTSEQTIRMNMYGLSL